jgi:lipopolysaccharide/colanic/teichoic acid biosynthesis glycosyltransferase
MTRSKRALDIIGSGLGLVLLAPLLAGIAAAIRFVDGGPVLFRQHRTGRNGKPFSMLKFRTMHTGPARASLITIGADPRITRLGRWLRRYKLDELPQLWNVLTGEMSLVGPRPEVERYTRLYTADQRRVLQFTPGITDPASLKYRGEADLLARAADPEGFYIAHVMPDKIAINLAYSARATVLSDLRLIMRTVGVLLPAVMRSPQEASGSAGLTAGRSQ